MKAVGHYVVQDLGADRAPLAARAYDSNGSRLKEDFHRRGCCGLRAFCRLRFEFGRRSYGEGDAEDAAVESSLYFEARVHEDIHHRAVVAQNVCFERRYIVVASYLCQSLQHARSDASAL